MLGCMTVFAQKVDKKEMKQLQAFLSQPAEKDGTNAQALKIVDMNAPSTWEGVTVANGHVTAIEWKDKKLGGSLDLSNFSALATVDVSRNKLTSLNVSGDVALTELNASRNALSAIDLEGCSSLTKVNIYRNQIGRASCRERV